MGRTLAIVATGLFCTGLAGCSGGGGGGGGGGTAASDAPLQYNGNTSSAQVSNSNAGILVADVMGDSSVAVVLAGAAPGTGMEASPGIVYATRRVTLSLRTAAAHQRGDGVLTADPVNENDPCEDGGSVHLSGDVNPLNRTGTVNAAFNNCAQDGIIISGTATLRIDSAAPPAFDDDTTLSFGRLSLRGSVNFDITGSIRLVSHLSTGTDTTTENVVVLNNDTGRMTRLENVVIVDTPNLPFNNGTSFTESISGRVFDGVHGFVDITTPVPLAFPTLTQSFPSGGELLLTGAAGRHIRVMPSSAIRVALGLDVDGNGMERTVLLGWGDLAGAIGSDLGDADGDGMHNSWESAFGLNPNVQDKTGDPDADTFTNLEEYRGGGNPNSMGSTPALIISPAFAVATNLTNSPSSDTENPGKSGVASDGSNFLFVSCRDRGPSPGVFGVLTSRSGQILSNFLISSDACPQRPGVVFDGSNYYVVIVRNGEVIGLRVTRSGTVLNAPGDPISASADGSINSFPSVAFDGTNYLVVWQKVPQSGVGVDIHGAKVTTAGVVSTPFPISSAGQVFLPVVGFGSSNYLVAWTRGSAPGTQDVVGALVATDGSVSPEIAIADLAGDQGAGGVAFDGTNYLVVWDHSVTQGVSPPPDGQIFGRRVSQAGVLLDGASNTAGIPISSGLFANHSSSVTFAGSSFLVTWAVGSFPNFPPAGIFAARVSKNGVRLDGDPSQLGMFVSAPSSSARLVHPVAVSNHDSALIGLVNESSSEDILAAPVISP